MIGKSKSTTPPVASNSITTGDITNATGIAIGPGARATVTQVSRGASDEVIAVFNTLTARVAALPDSPDRAVALSAVKALEAEAKKGDQADEGNVSRWLKFLAQAAPDIWEVAVDTFHNPIKGLSTVFKKVAERAKAEREAQQPVTGKA